MVLGNCDEDRIFVTRLVHECTHVINSIVDYLELDGRETVAYLTQFLSGELFDLFIDQSYESRK